MAAAIALEPTAAGIGSDFPPGARAGNILTKEMVEAGWSVDAKGRLFDPSGYVVRDEFGNYRGPREPFAKQETFDKARRGVGGDQSQRDAYTGRELDRIAEQKGWEVDIDKTKKAGRKVYKAGKDEFYTRDLSHGQFERYNKYGKHQGQYDIEGNKTKEPKRNYDFKW